MRELSRKEFLKMTGMGFIGFQLLSCMPKAESKALIEKFGPLLKDPKGILDLPQGFSYKIISKMGELMSDGFLVPGLADGMATFAGKDGRVILVRNHEIDPDENEFSPYGEKNTNFKAVDKEKVYDICDGKNPALGGTTTLIYNPEKQEVEKQFLSLTGTVNNCCGGPTPWGSWISCEEFDDGDLDLKNENFFTKAHGFNFEVPAEHEGLVDPIPLKAMGRFNHEAIAVDPKTGICYQTEDQHDGLFYRFIPKVKGDFKQGGKLQALALDDTSKDIRNWEKSVLKIGEKLSVRWIDIDDVEAEKEYLLKQGFRKGATRFARGEGIWFGDGELYFACTSGGPIKLGQIFKYTPSSHEGQSEEKNKAGQLELFVETKDKDILKSCDNITISPFKDLIVCEDHGADSFIDGVTPSGEVYKFAKNVGYKSEFAGACFSPDGKTLFVNMQVPGLTFAITGPWV